MNYKHTHTEHTRHVLINGDGPAARVPIRVYLITLRVIAYEPIEIKILPCCRVATTGTAEEAAAALFEYLASTAEAIDATGEKFIYDDPLSDYEIYSATLETEIAITTLTNRPALVIGARPEQNEAAR